jgi:hypothetical protein
VLGSLGEASPLGRRGVCSDAGSLSSVIVSRCEHQKERGNRLWAGKGRRTASGDAENYATSLYGDLIEALFSNQVYIIEFSRFSNMKFHTI